jgi:hypothetical protein
MGTIQNTPMTTLCLYFAGSSRGMGTLGDWGASTWLFPPQRPIQTSWSDWVPPAGVSAQVRADLTGDGSDIRRT